MGRLATSSCLQQTLSADTRPERFALIAALTVLGACARNAQSHDTPSPDAGVRDAGVVDAGVAARERRETIVYPDAFSRPDVKRYHVALLAGGSLKPLAAGPTDVPTAVRFTQTPGSSSLTGHDSLGHSREYRVDRATAALVELADGGVPVGRDTARFWNPHVSYKVGGFIVYNRGLPPATFKVAEMDGLSVYDENWRCEFPVSFESDAVLVPTPSCAPQAHYLVDGMSSAPPRVIRVAGLAGAEVHFHGWQGPRDTYTVLANHRLTSVNRKSGVVTPIAPRLPEVVHGQARQDLGVFLLLVSGTLRGQPEGATRLHVFDFETQKQLAVVRLPNADSTALIGASYRFEGRRYAVVQSALVDLDAARIVATFDEASWIIAAAPQSGCLYAGRQTREGAFDPRRIVCLDPKRLTVKASAVVGVAGTKEHDRDALLIEKLFVLPDETVAVLLSSGIETNDHLHVME